MVGAYVSCFGVGLDTCMRLERLSAERRDGTLSLTAYASTYAYHSRFRVPLYYVVDHILRALYYGFIEKPKHSAFGFIII